MQVIKQAAKAPPRHPLKRSISSSQHEHPRKKQKIQTEKPKQLVSNRRFEPKVIGKKKKAIDHQHQNWTHFLCFLII